MCGDSAAASCRPKKEEKEELGQAEACERLASAGRMMNVSRRRKRYKPPETPHFFKIILSDTLRAGKLMIPRSFVAKHGKSLPNQLLLKVAGDANWPVELEKGDERVWICKGWRDFLDYYSINHGHLIVFRYEGGSIFHVLIFDKSTSEIVYPQKPIAPEKSLDPEIVEIDDVSMELGEHIISPKDRGRELKSPSGLASPSKLMMKSDLVSKDQNKSCSRLRTPRHEAKSSHSGERRSSKLKKNVNWYCSSRDYGGRIRKSGKKATPFEQIYLRSRCPNPSDALKKARKFKSEHPSFLVVMRSCNLTNSNLHVPSGFMKSQIKKSLVAEDTTLVFRGGSWTVRFFNYPHHYAGKFSAGWPMFSTDNSLRSGDVCVFELIKNTPMVFRVSIFRHAG